MEKNATQILKRRLSAGFYKYGCPLSKHFMKYAPEVNCAVFLAAKKRVWGVCVCVRKAQKVGITLPL